MRKEFDWFDRPGVKRILIGCLAATILALLAIDFFVHKHPLFGWDGIPLFYAGYGFLGCVLLVLTARLIRPLVKREEDYYD